MKRILFLANADNHSTDNLVRFERTFSRAGWQTQIASHQSIWLEGSTLAVANLEHQAISELISFDLIWVLGFGSRSTFLDRMQLLSRLDPSHFVNTIDACLHLQNKAVYAFTSVASHLPVSYCGEDVDLLMDKVNEGGNWIAKPPAGSFGRDVYWLNQDDPNLQTILEHLTSQSHVLLQEAVNTTNEKRWMLVNGEVLGVYAKNKNEGRGNIAAGSQPTLTEATPQELRQMELIAQSLVNEGIRVCAVDMAYPFLLDINFINPGWFQSMETLTGKDLSTRIPAMLTLS